MEMALQIVRLQQKKSIGTEHLLWGLARLAEADKAILTQLFSRLDWVRLNEKLSSEV
jgi:putative transcriptional regulator